MLSKLIWKNISKNKFIATMSIFVLFIVIFFSSFLNFIYSNIQHILIDENIWQEKNKFIVKPTKWSFIGSKIWIKQNLKVYYQELKKDKKVEKIFGIYKVDIPVQSILSFLNINFKTDMLIFASDKDNQIWENINIWISPTLLNLYNTQIANNILPILNKDILSTVNITISFWKNSFIKYKNIVTTHWHIKSIDTDFPLLWLTIPYNLAIKIQKQLWRWTIKLIQIVWYTKKHYYLQSIKEKYKNKLNIQTVNEKKEKINRQTKIVKDIFNVIKYIIYIITISFLVLLALHIYYKNSKNLKVLYYHGANFLQRFNIVFFEMFIYFLIAVIINIFIVCIFNIYFVSIINKKIIAYGLYNINIIWISFENILLNSLMSLIVIIIVFLSVFIKKK